MTRSSFTLFLMAATGWAQTHPVTLEIQPTTIAVSPSYSEAQARVIVKNGLARPIRTLELSVFNNDGLKIEIGKASTTRAQPNHAVVWPIRISEPAHARLPAAAVFELKYRLMDQETCFRVFTTLAVTSQAESKPVEASIEGNFDAISQQRPGEGALSITNNLDLPVDIEIKALPGSEFMRIDPIPRFQIPPRSTVRKAVRINAESRVTPGAYPAQFEVSASWNWVGKPEERHLIVTKQATLGVFFESELLKALSIPSFLVLPGCLAIFTMQMLLAFNVLGAKNESKLPDLGATTPSFWILSITYSGVYAALYIVLTKNNYLLRYGMEDLIRVWLSSILIGAVLYLGIALYTLRERRLSVPTATDDQVTVLRKMARNGLGLVAPEVRFTLNNTAWRGYAIEPIQDGNTHLWVAPPIATEWGGSAAARARETDHNADLTMAQNPAAANAPADIAQSVADRLDAAKRDHQVEVRWDPAGPVPAVAGPVHIKTEAITSYMAPGRIIR